MIAAAALLLVSWLGAEAPPDAPATMDARSSLTRAIAFLVRSQNADGSWGDKRGALPVDLFGSNQTNHDLAKRAVTALSCLALQEAGEKPEDKAALERGVNFLLAGEPSQRPSNWEVYNVWSYIYALQAFARVYGDPAWANSPLHAKLKLAGEKEAATLLHYQSPAGGWGYYDFEAFAHRPSWATSFTTGAAIVALVEAKQQGFVMDEKILPRAVAALSRCQLPSGAYTYSVEAIPSPRFAEWIDQIKGSLGRIQVGNIALFLAGAKVPVATMERGIDLLFEHHKFLDVAVKRPIPHEAYYYNSGYFYYFGHHYAAMVIERLSEKAQSRFWPKLQEAIVSRQESDGSFWDWFMNDYNRPYATAFAAMALHRSLASAKN